MEYRLIPQLCAAFVRTATQRIWRGSSLTARCASPVDADRGGTPGKESRTFPPVPARRPCSGGVARKFAPHSPAHHYACRDRRGLQFDPRLPTAYSGAAHWLHPDCGCACWWDFAPAEDCEPSGTVSRPDGVPRRDGYESCVYGRGVAF